MQRCRAAEDVILAPPLAGPAGSVLLVHPALVPGIIGKQGRIVQTIERSLGVKVRIRGPSGPASDVASQDARQVEVLGLQGAVCAAIRILNDILMYSHHEVTHPGMVHAELVVPPRALGRVVGQRGRRASCLPCGG